MITSLNCYMSTLCSCSDTHMQKIQQHKRKTHGFCTFSCFGPHIWNSLTQDLRHCSTQTPNTVYDILPSVTAIFSYAIGSRKLSANEQFSVGAQTVVSLLQLIQITQIISDVCFIIDHDAYTSSNKTKIVWTETELFFYPGWMCLIFMCMLGLLLSY